MVKRVTGLGGIPLYLLRKPIFIEEKTQRSKAIFVHGGT
jgi:hypothetical protein